MDQGNKIQQSLFEKLLEDPFKKEPSRFSTFTKILKQNKKKQCLNLQRLKTCHYTIRKIQVQLDSHNLCLFSSSPCHKHKRDK